MIFARNEPVMTLPSSWEGEGSRPPEVTRSCNSEGAFAGRGPASKSSWERRLKLAAGRGAAPQSCSVAQGADGVGAGRAPRWEEAGG